MTPEERELRKAGKMVTNAMAFVGWLIILGFLAWEIDRYVTAAGG